MKKNTELRAMSVDDLKNELLSLRKTQFGYRFKKASDEFSKTHVIKNVRRAIARVKTIITEKTGVNS